MERVYYLLKFGFHKNKNLFFTTELSEALQKGTTITNKGGDSVKIPTNVEIFDKERFIRFELACVIPLVKISASVTLSKLYPNGAI